MAAEMRGTSEEDALAAREVGRHGMVCGSSGAGKSYGLVIITNGWSSSGARRLQLIDPKGETVLMKSLHVAADYLVLPGTEREAFAARFRVFDVTPDALTPVNLFAVPTGMSPSLLASLRAAATRHMSGHDYAHQLRIKGRERALPVTPHMEAEASFEKEENHQCHCQRLPVHSHVPYLTFSRTTTSACLIAT